MRLAEAINERGLKSLTLQYGVIFSVNGEVTNRNYWLPRRQHKIWEKTETGPSEYREHGEAFKKWRRSKWVAVLDQGQFDEFVDHAHLVATGEKTMGSLGAPAPEGTVLGLSPAVHFEVPHDGYDDMSTCAYVTPYVMQAADSPEFEEFDGADWDVVEAALVKKYEDG